MASWLTGYTYRKAITVARGHVDSDLTDFPLKIALRNTATYGPKDLTQGLTPTASSTQAGSAAVNAVDNSTSTYWTSNTAGSLPVTIQVDLGANCGVILGKYTISPRTADANGKPTAWKLQGSNNGTDWTDLDSQTGQTWANDNPVTYTIASPGTVSYRYFRLYISATGGGVYVQIMEWTLYQYLPSNFDFAKAMANGYDIRFTDDDETTLLKFERELYGSSQVLLANSGTASADSVQGTYYASNCSDSNTGTFWATPDSGSGHWWKYDYGAGVTKTVVKVAISPYVNGWGINIKGIKIQGSNNDSDWTDLYTGQVANSSATQAFELTATGAYRYYRILSTDATQWSGHAMVAMNEVYFYENSSETNGVFWVKIPTLPTASNKTIYIYYGKAGDTDGSDKTNVWDSYHKGVWHLSEVGVGAAGEFKDSTTNANNGAGNSGLTRATGVAGFGQTTTASYDVQVPDHATLEPGTQDFTWSGKYKFSSVGNNCFIGRGGSGTSYFYFAWETSGIRFRDYNSGNIIDFTVTGWTPVVGEWYDIEVTRSGSSFKIFVDNVQIGSTATDADGFLDRSVAWQFGGNTQISYAFVGVIDEIRMSFGLARADAWRKARIYSDYETMQTLGDEEEGGGETYTLSPALEWTAAGLTRLSPSLEWFVSKARMETPSLDWYGTGPKFAPNLIHYPFYFETPTIKNSKVSLGWTGCAPGYSVTMANTGSSGETVIGVYVKGVLKSTLTVPATGVEYVKLQHMKMDVLLNPLDEFEVRVTSVATGASDLKVSLYEMTFPFSMEVLDCGNLTENLTAFWGLQDGWLFTQADAWFVEVNQPILELVSAVAINSNDSETEISAEITNGHFYQNRVVVSSLLEEDTVKLRFYVRDLGQIVRTIEKSVEIKTTLADFPDYAIAENTGDEYSEIAWEGDASDDITRTPIYSSCIFTGGTASASSTNGGEVAAYGFDESENTFWTSTVGAGMPQWLAYDLGEGQSKIINKYSIRARTNIGIDPIYSGDSASWPEAWTLQGSNNGTDWTVLDTQSGITWTMADQSSKSFYLADNTVGYRHYRLVFTDSSGSYIQIREWYAYTDLAVTVPNNLIDGDVNKVWPDLTNTSVPEYWMFDFGAANEKAIKQISLLAPSDANGLYAKDFIVAGSNETTPDMESDDDWTYVYGNRMSNDATLYGEYQTFSFNNQVEYRYYRLKLISTHNTAGYAAFSEMKFFEKNISSLVYLKTFATYLPFDSYQYSFDDGVTWVAGIVVGTKFATSVDFSGKAEGTYAMKFRYVMNGVVYTDSKSIIYTVGDIDAYVQWGPSYFQVLYNDTIPLEKVEMYLDDVLSGTSVPMVGSGFTTCTLSTAAQTLTISAGSISYLGVTYAWAGSAISLAGIGDTAYRMRVAFGFNTSTKEFETQIYEPSIFGEKTEDAFSNFIVIWIQDIYVQYNTTSEASTVTGGGNQWKIFTPEQIGFPITDDVIVRVVIYDIAGRTLTQALNFKVIVKNEWYTLTVTDGNGNIVIDGQIVQTDTLTYTVTKDENP